VNCLDVTQESLKSSFRGTQMVDELLHERSGRNNTRLSRNTSRNGTAERWCRRYSDGGRYGRWESLYVDGRIIVLPGLGDLMIRSKV
jgi:hypothetical protein